MPRPDEGLIHAWLDGQLPADEAARVEQLAATDAEWAAAVAEARGLIAASSRILSSLDHAPAGVMPKPQSAQPTWRMPWWTKVAAAIVVVAGGSVLVFERANLPEIATAPAAKSTDAVVDAPTTKPPVTAPTAATPAPKQSVASALPRAATLESKNKMNAAVPAAGTVPLAVEAQQKTETTDRISPAMPSSLLTKDVAAKAAAAAPRAAAPATTSLGGVTTMRAVGGAGAQARAAEPVGADAQIARRVSGVTATQAPASIQAAGPRCYRLHDPNAPAEMGIIMRMMSMDGDTLRLEATPGTSGLRAWIVWRDGRGHGAMTTADGKGAIAVDATASACPTP